MAGLFIEDGPICQVKGREEKAYEWKDRDKSVLYSGPLTVMVDENSASASEIFAAAIQDYKRGLIVGSTSTYGKGTVQRNIPLNADAQNDIFGNDKGDDLGTVKLTFQKFYRINGGATQLKGVTPDIIIPDRLEFAKTREKDNPTCLSWDEITKADYKPWTSTYSTDAIATTTNDQIRNNTTFSSLRMKLDSISRLDDKAYSLNLQKYRADQDKLKATYKQLEALYKLPKELNVKNVDIDVAAITADKEKTEKNKQFVNRIKDDIYIDETVKVMNNMISQSNMVKTN